MCKSTKAGALAGKGKSTVTAEGPGGSWRSAWEQAAGGPQARHDLDSDPMTVGQH